MYGSAITDFTRVLNDGTGLTREIKIDNPAPDMYFRLANGASIEEISPGLYLIDNQSYYLRLENVNGAKAIVRDQDGRKELIIPAGAGFSYSILF